ncbi:MAG: biosynthetic-type acetolactate synthase large subunit [Acetobacteraceae bacterium]
MSDSDHPVATSSITAQNGAQQLLDLLVEHGVDVIFGYPGGAVLPIYDALHQRHDIRHILVRHEQAAVHAAEGYARATGRPGIVLVTSGPGATNAVTGLVDALMDSIPIVCICGQVPSALIGNDAFQEADTTGITRPATKYNYLVKHGKDLAPIVREAFRVATTGRPGPVLIDLPKDISVGKIEAAPSRFGSRRRPYAPQTRPDPSAIREAMAMMKKARRPLFYTGGGVINAGPGASAALRELVRKTDFPVTSTLMGLGAVPTTDPHFLGMLGMHGSYEANLATHDCDLLIALGARFDDRVTGRVDTFSPGSLKIHADIDPAQINKIIRADYALIGDVGLTLQALNEMWEGGPNELSQWWQMIDGWRAVDSFAFKQDMDPAAIIRPQHAIKRLYEATRKMKTDVYVSTEVGQHQMWAAQHFHFDAPNHWLTSGGLGTMGYGLPAAIGAQIAHPEGLVIDIAGEASILMNIQELGTMAQYDLPVKIFILNNRYMGMVRQWQELLHGSRYAHSYSEALPDFTRLAEAFHGKGVRATCIGELDAAIETMLTHKGSVVAEICVSPDENCFPMIPSGAAHNEMLLGPDRQTDAARITDEGIMLV